jgi:hypothetical protein
MMPRGARRRLSGPESTGARGDRAGAATGSRDEGRTRLLAAACLALVLLGACGRAPKRAVLGEWSAGGERMEFLVDGRLLLKHADGSASIAGWEFPEPRLLRLRELAATPADYRVAVTRDSLVLCRAAALAECWRFSRTPGGRR